MLKLTATPSALAVEGNSPFPVRISANNRYLEDASGQPFLLHGDTAWYLVSELTKEETEEYLENRRQKGFNTILVSLGETDLTDKPTATKYGDPMFTTPDDFSTPNEKFFAHVDWAIHRAREKGILVVLNPCYTGTSVSRKDALAKYIPANGPTKCRNYGRYIGNRYKNSTNIIWQAVGDLTPTPGSEMEKNWLEILMGIKEHAPDHLWTAHYRRFSTALDQAAFAPHMSIDNAYGGNRSYVHTLRAYNRASPKPTFYNEGFYEDTHLGATADVGKPPMLRAQAYWAILSGATGHIFGSGHVFGFGNSFYIKPALRDWRTGMDRQGSREMVHVKRLFDGRAWQNLVPDQNHSVVTRGYGTFGEDDRTPGGDYVTAARTSDGSLVMAYVPSTGTHPRTITVDMARLCGPATGHWYNPTSGALSAIEGSPMANSGERDFTTPCDNASGSNDWVLVLQAAAPPPRPATGDSSSSQSPAVKVDWKVFCMPHKHLDVGFNYMPQGALDQGYPGSAEEIHNFVTMRTLYLREASKDFPREAQYRWTFDATWQLEQAAMRFPGRIEEIRRLVNSGEFSYNPTYAHLHPMYISSSRRCGSSLIIRSSRTFRPRQSLPSR